MDDGELLCAASVGHVEVGRLLIENGADPNEIIEKACGNALHAAAAMRYTSDARRFIEMLLAHGADLEAHTSDGRTALQIAEAGKRKQDEAPAHEGNLLAIRPCPPHEPFLELRSTLGARHQRSIVCKHLRLLQVEPHMLHLLKPIELQVSW